MIHWIKAARLRTLPLSLSGIILGSLIAKYEGFWSWNIFLSACITTILFQIVSNFANDYGDGIKGTDNEERIGPARMIQSGFISQKEMKNAILFLSSLSIISAIFLIYLAFGKENIIYSLIFFGLGIASIMAAINYTVGNSAYGYRGLGDVFVFIFFGLLAVLGTYFLFNHQFNFLLILPASAIGLLSTAVLNLNNMRDVNSDRNAEKNTLVVKIGFQKAKKYQTFLIITPFLLLTLYCLLINKIDSLGFLIFFIPMFFHLKKVANTTEPKTLDSELKKVALTTFFISLILGLSLNIF
ncbi:MAG: 1,4-dihydroxy-2-naphthoate octaprenyltransferase [Flavobacteriales bacterium]